MIILAIVLLLLLYCHDCTTFSAANVYSLEYGIRPRSISFLKGKTIVLKCISGSPPKWFFEDKSIRRATYIDNTIYIRSATTSHTGIFKCIGTNKYMDVFESTVNVFIGGKRLNTHRLLSCHSCI